MSYRELPLPPPVEDKLSANGYRIIRRFGYGIPDGCGFPLSLKAENQKKSNWNTIVADADEALMQFETSNHNRRRRASMMTPRIIFISPDPERGWERFFQAGHSIPLRKYTSELLFDSPDLPDMCSEETRRHLRWNASCEDLRHLLSSNEFHGTQDEFSLSLSTKNSRKLKNHHHKPISFTRNSNSLKKWDIHTLEKEKRYGYEYKLNLIRKSKLVDKVKLDTSSDLVNDLKDDVKVTLQHDNLIVDVSDKKNSSKREDLNTIAKSAIRLNKIDLKPIDSTVSIDDLDVYSVAIGLTYIEAELLLNINITEVSRMIFRPESVDQESCPDIASVLEFQNRLIKLLITCILEPEEPNKRADRISFIVRVCEHLKKIKNWQSLSSLITSLQAPPIARLRETWNCFRSYSTEYFQFIDFSEMFRDEANLSHENQGPSIPMFDDWLDNIKYRCSRSLENLKYERVHRNWKRPSVIVNWVYQETKDMKESDTKEVNNNNNSKVKHERFKKSRNFLRRLRKNLFRRKRKNKLNVSNIMNEKEVIANNACEAGSISSNNKSIDDDDDDDILRKHNEDTLKVLMSSQYPSPRYLLSSQEVINASNSHSSLKDHHPVDVLLDINDLKPEEERILMKEISYSLEEYQDKANMYEFSPNQKVLQFLLFKSYDHMDECIKRSCELEKPIKM